MPLAGARTGDSLREGVRNGTTSVETEIIGNLRSTTAPKGGYVTRQSNLSLTGGGAIYGCRSQAGGSLARPTPQNPCLRANNLSRGLAFEFHTTLGDVAGAISVGAGGDAKKPFTTNATGVATGLNADRVDGQSASEIIAAARAKPGLDADTLDGKDAADFLPAATIIPFSSKLSIGAERVIATNGTVSLVHQCIDQGGGTFESRIIARTTAAGAVTDGDDDYNGNAGNTLEPTTADNDSEIMDNSSTATSVENEIDDGWVLSANAEDYLGVDGESTAIGVRFAGANCVVVGHAGTA